MSNLFIFYQLDITQVKEDIDDKFEIVVENNSEYDANTFTDEPQEEKVFVSPQKPKGLKRKKVEEDPRITETYKIIKDILEKRQTPKVKNDCTIFGEYIASKLQLFDQRTRALLQNQISSIICHTEIDYICNNPVNQALQ